MSFGDISTIIKKEFGPDEEKYVSKDTEVLKAFAQLKNYSMLQLNSTYHLAK